MHKHTLLLVALVFTSLQANASVVTWTVDATFAAQSGYDAGTVTGTFDWDDSLAATSAALTNININVTTSTGVAYFGGTYTYQVDAPAQNLNSLWLSRTTTAGNDPNTDSVLVIAFTAGGLTEGNTDAGLTQIYEARCLRNPCYYALENNISAYDFRTTEVGTLTASPVPVPAAVWLFGSGLLGLVGIARRKKA